MRLHGGGLNSSRVGRLTGIPRSTIRGWIRPRYVAQPRRGPRCFRCDFSQPVTEARYVYLFGLYLGDGCLSQSRKGVWRLRIFQDARYTGLITECREAIAAVAPSCVSMVQRAGCVEIVASWMHWPHVFPQHGPGPKHKRTIALEEWQRPLTERHAQQFLRGLIHSDGCRHLNIIRSSWPTGAAVYKYPRYQFTNASEDIRKLFTDACERLGVRWTQMNARNVAVSRRSDVAFLDTFIGCKS